MSEFMGMVKILIVSGAVLVALLMILLSMPSSQLRNFLVQIIGWAVAVFCGVYVVCPFDVIPDFIPVVGWIDDVGAIVGGISSAVMALNAGKANK